MSVSEAAARPSPGFQRLRAGARAITGRTGLWIGASLFALLVLFALLGPLLIPADPLKTNPVEALHGPSLAHPFGTDFYGRDVLARVADASRRDLLIPALIVLAAASIGTLAGVLAGFLGTWVDQVVMRVTDVVLSFPSLLLALVIVAAIGNSVTVVVLALATAHTPYFIRITRSRVLSERTIEYVDAAVTVGNPRWRVGLRHVLPNSLSPTLAQATLAFGWAVLDTAGLAFLGVGITAPTPEWGLMVGEGTRDVLSGVWWTSTIPGLFILLLVMSAVLTGSGLRERRR
ncbi:MAG: ABC transporter permease [Gaiellaceae bacterium]